MTVQSMVTIVAPVARDKVEGLRKRIGDTLANPASETFRAAVESASAEHAAPFLHFSSLHAFVSRDGKRGYLALEFSADGTEAFGIAELARRAGPLLQPLFAEASDWQPGQGFGDYLRGHQVKIGSGLFDTAGLAFSGTPGLSVSDIHAEDALTREVARLLATHDDAPPPLGRLKAVRDAIAGTSFAWALETPPPAIKSPDKDASILTKIVTLAPAFVATYLWPLLLVLLPLCLWLAWPDTDAGPDWTLKTVLGLAAGALGLVALFTLIILGLMYLAFVRQEARDFVSDAAPEAGEHARMTARENAPGCVQNHMVSQTELKPGFLRYLTVRLAFWIIARLTALNPKPGHLGDIGTIHFARWVAVPGTRDLLFFSNYGGSWESYLEDFITKAHEGLTAVWSNTTGFPRSRNLFADGATDGERFKRYARASMVHTPFWYSAYPGLTTANIRTNRLVRRGLAAAMNESQAVEWLACFGSAPRPLAKLETTQIQSLVFGGMGFKPEGRLLVLRLGDDIGKNREWLGGVLPRIAFNDGRYMTADALITFAAGRSGLARLGLDAAALATFPAAFLQGMHGPGRERILGDVETNAREHWAWGQDGEDIVLLVYGDPPRPGETRPVDRLHAELEALTVANGGRITHVVELTPAGDKLSDRKEPFGFVDGVSQPAMRGTYRGLRNDDPIHLVEPGEFVLGYPDNRGNVPPGPVMDARCDPGLRLPVAGMVHGFGETVAENPRLIGYNGSFLVIRQLEQDSDGFEDFCMAEGERLKDAFPDLPLETENMAAYVGAKMIGRWQDGSSLVRYPYLSASRLQEKRREAQTAVSRPESHPADAAATPVPPADARPQTGVAGASKLPDIKPDNDFLFGTEDPQGQRCPYGAHIRRANPRESLSPGSNDQIDISNRHRILRVGRGYLGEDGQTRGLMFMCLNGDIERQFEFIQQTWMGSTKFHGLDAEADPIAGRGLAKGEGNRCDGFTIPSRRGPVGLSPLPQFVTVRGGGYFFLPGRQLLRYLATPEAASRG